MTDLTVEAWILLALAAVLVGFAKTAVGGVASISVAIFAAVLPARESTGALLPLLMAGDVLAIAAYRRHTDWATLLRLSPSVVAGVLAGVAFVAFADDTVMRRTIGAVLIALLAVHLWTRRRPQPEAAEPARRAVTTSYGTLAGFTTMVANAGGPVMTLYLLSARFSVLGFLGTAAWFFALVNLFKVPFSVGLGLISWDSLRLDLLLLPGVLAGALAGRLVIGRLDQVLFERLVVAFTLLTALWLLR